MLLRCVLSTVCVVLMAPVVPARARSSDTRSDTRIAVEASRVMTIQSPDDGIAGGPPVVVLEVPTITCPMVMIAANPEIDPRFVTRPPKDTTFTIRSVTPTACR